MSANATILVTGSSRGFGRLIAETLARNGHHVFASMRDAAGRNAAASAAVHALAEKEHLPLEVVELDVTDDASVDRAVERVLESAGRIDVLVNNAGVVPIGLLEEFTLEEFQRHFDTNFFGAVRLNRAVLPSMRRRHSGLLVHISSGFGRIVGPFFGIYCAAKYALEALAEVYRYELYDTGVDSVLIEPGIYGTGIQSRFLYAEDRTSKAEYGWVGELPEKLHEALLEFVSSSDAANPQDIADAVTELIATPPGERPMRTHVWGGGAPEFMTQLEGQAERSQNAMLDLIRDGLGVALPSQLAGEANQRGA